MTDDGFTPADLEMRRDPPPAADAWVILVRTYGGRVSLVRARSEAEAYEIRSRLIPIGTGNTGGDGMIAQVDIIAPPPRPSYNWTRIRAVIRTK